MSTQRPNVGFPYTDDMLAPNTDGLITDGNTGRDITMSFPNSGKNPWPKNRGTIMKGEIGDTDFIDTNTVAHAVLAGDS